MASIALEDSAGPERAETVGSDSLGHAVQVALAIYLMPVIAIVCVIGGASIVIERASRLMAGRGGQPARLVKPGHVSIARPVRIRTRERNRTRVGR